MTFKNSAKIASGLLIASVALVGCSSDDPEEPTATPTATEEAPTEPETTAAEPTEEPSTPAEEPSEEPGEQGPVSGGDTFSGTGYDLVIPEGWASNEELNTGGPMELLLTKDGETTTDSINIIVAPAGGQSLDTLVPQAKGELESQASEIEDAPDKTVDGQPSKGFQGTLTTGNLEFAQYYIIHNDQAYIITFGGPEGSQAVDTLYENWTFTS